MAANHALLFPIYWWPHSIISVGDWTVHDSY